VPPGPDRRMLISDVASGLALQNIGLTMIDMPNGYVAAVAHRRVAAAASEVGVRGRQESGIR
jgi:hypothetical protein